MARSERLLSSSRNLAIGALAVVLSYGGYLYVVRFGNLDPFRSLKRGLDPLGANTGLRLSNVRIHQYQKGRLMTSFRADQIDVTKDRNTFDMRHVKNGAYYGPDQTVHFAADNGQWNTPTQRLQVKGGVRAEGKDFDLQTSVANFDRRDENLRVPTNMVGRLYGGSVHAASLTYNMRTGDARTGAVRWQGKVPAKVVQATDEAITPRIWSITGETSSRHHGIDVFEGGRATDGEVLVIAPHVEREISTDVLTATGRVSYFSGKCDLVADKVVVYRKEKRAVFTGNVLMLVKPKKDQDKPPKEEEVPTVKPEPPSVKVSEEPTVLTQEEKKRDEDLRSGRTLRDYPLNIKAQSITYWYGKGQRHAIIEGDPVARQDFADGRWRHGTSHDGYYDGEQDTLQLNSAKGHRDATLKNSIGDLWKAATIKFSTKEDQTENDEDVTTTLVSAIIVDRSGEDTRAPKKGNSTPPNSPATQPPPPPGGGGSSKTGGGGRRTRV